MQRVSFNYFELTVLPLNEISANVSLNLNLKIAFKKFGSSRLARFKGYFCILKTEFKHTCHLITLLIFWEK